MPQQPPESDPSQSPQPPQPGQPPEIPTAAYALKFGGLMVTVGGALAILRTGEQSVLYAIMMPLGLALWGIGFYMQLKATRPPGDGKP